ncbi:hypothetical protein GCM10010441_07970 [Kitasatospora paracochleata]|uniref:Transposase n=1 Tax=Kitasatospora paracochleata TaxID=58354 RepID=A0ABT1J9L3_9ACTN|nr:hypothetical protein [Kitasatospora paracochleata]MCP2314130.1 hypothetical protein [Kitasatospora paracochleata]
MRVQARLTDRTMVPGVKARHDAPRRLPAEPERMKMAKLQREIHCRQLGSGYCARRVKMDCHF